MSETCKAVCPGSGRDPEVKGRGGQKVREYWRPRETRGRSRSCRGRRTFWIGPGKGYPLWTKLPEALPSKQCPAGRSLQPGDQSVLSLWPQMVSHPSRSCWRASLSVWSKQLLMRCFCSQNLSQTHRWWSLSLFVAEWFILAHLFTK